MKFSQEEELFVRQIINAKEQLQKNNKVTLFKFLDQRKQSIIKNIMNDCGENLMFFGGFQTSEYQRCMISPFDISGSDLKVIILKIDYNKKYLTISHKNVLGNLMSLGIKRESIGDIVVEDGDVYFACTKEILPFLQEEFKVFNKMPINLEIVNELEVTNTLEYDEKEIIVSSLRLDVILSKVHNFSRNESKEIIENKRVKVNHLITTNISLLLKEGDLLSVNKKGRVKFFSISSVTSKGKYKIRIGYLI